ncbi:MAG: hypothetical protein ACI9G1_003093 [Pirellulaceae bacterium]|jgi:hypothetical protein
MNGIAENRSTATAANYLAENRSTATAANYLEF